MVFDWNEAKSTILKESRGIGFERIVIAIENGDALAIIDHPNKERYRNQVMIIVKIHNYAYAVHAVKDKDFWFLNTIIPSIRNSMCSKLGNWIYVNIKLKFRIF